MATINEKDCTGPWEIEEHISDLFQKLSTHWKTQQWPILRANQLKLFRDKILVWIKETEESFMALTTHTVFETSHTDFHSLNKPISADQCSDLEGVDQKSEPYSPLATTKEESVLEV
uniref:Uncharacterized protein n=1 Tax=Biomphalaria glabrata TaxID=6526 RepID=A0A2C9LUZ5_BIOGL